MSHAFYMDVHVASAVTAGLRRCGVDVLTSQEDGTRESSDIELLERATTLDRILFSQDDDLLVIASRWQHQGREFSGLVYGHQLSLGIGDLIAELELLATCAEDHEIRNHVIYLPLS